MQEIKRILQIPERPFQTQSLISLFFLLRPHLHLLRHRHQVLSHQGSVRYLPGSARFLEIQISAYVLQQLFK